MLPLAAAAHPEVLAHRSHTKTTGAHHALDVALGITVLLAVNLHINHVARSAKGHKHHKVVPPPQALALGGNTSNLEILQQRQIFLLSHVTIYALFCD